MPPPHAISARTCPCGLKRFLTCLHERDVGGVSPDGIWAWKVYLAKESHKPQGTNCSHNEAMSTRVPTALAFISSSRRTLFWAL